MVSILTANPLYYKNTTQDKTFLSMFNHTNMMKACNLNKIHKLSVGTIANALYLIKVICMAANTLLYYFEHPKRSASFSKVPLSNQPGSSLEI